MRKKYNAPNRCLSNVLHPIGAIILKRRYEKMIKLEQIWVKIADAIKNSGLTQNELAAKIGVRRQQISCYIRGSKMPALDTFANLCAALDVDANEMLCVDHYKSK